MSYEDKDAFGMYGDKRAGAGPETRKGPGPELMGADTLVGSDVYNLQGEDIGDIKEIMLDMRSGRVGYAVLSFRPFLSLREKIVCGAVGRVDARYRTQALYAECGQGASQG